MTGQRSSSTSGIIQTSKTEMLSTAFQPSVGPLSFTSALVGSGCIERRHVRFAVGASRRSVRPVFKEATRSVPRMGVEQGYGLAEQAFLNVATRGDIGPFTNVDLETATLFGAIGGGFLVAVIIIIFIIRF